MRLFVAVRPSYDAAARLAAELGTGADPRWHVTLVFLGEVADPAPVDAALAPAVAAHRPFPLRLEGAGTFDGRVLWAGLGGDLDALRALRVDVARATASAGVVVTDAPYRPHLTVRRGRGLRPGALAGHRGPEWEVAEVQLVRSRLGGGPARHEVVGRYALSRAA